jgi:hypothetical protein
MKPKIIPLLESCIEDGLVLGFNRSHKHSTDPPEDEIFRHQANAIMDEIYERFEFKELK